MTTRNKREKHQHSQTHNYFKTAPVLFGYFWLLTRRTITQTIPIHQSIIRLPGRLRNKHAGGVRWYHNFPATTSDNMRASRIQEKLYDANQDLKNPSTSLQHTQMRWKTLERAENQSEPSPSFERSLKKL